MSSGLMLVAGPRRRLRSRHARLEPEQVAASVRAAAAGDCRAWDVLVREFGGLVWAVARAHRLRDADAADVSQATWLALLENLGRISDPARVGAWLATTARRECLRVIRGAQRQVPVDGDFEAPQDAELPADARLLTAERDRVLWRAFARLRATDQALLRLLMAEPSPGYEEISAALKMPIGSIGPTRARALGRLRALLDADGATALLAA